ncbi:hypothetical protein WMF30_11445 [Sorangium sp. So ce134]
MSWFRMASVALLGAATGIVAAVVAGRVGLLGASDPSEGPAAMVTQEPTGGPRPDRRPRTEDAQVSLRLARLEGELAALREQGAPQPEEPSTQEAVDEKAEEARIQKKFDTALAAFESATADPVWAPQASKSLQADLGALSERIGFDVDDVQCKDRRCVAQIRWDTYQNALQRYAAVAHAEYSVNCAIDVMVQRPSGASDEVTNPVLFSKCK